MHFPPTSRYFILGLNILSSCYKTSRLLSRKTQLPLNRNIYMFQLFQPSPGHQHTILKWGKIQYIYIHHTVSLRGETLLVKVNISITS